MAVGVNESGSLLINNEAGTVAYAGGEVSFEEIMSILDIDAGNTRLKWRVVDNRTVRAGRNCQYAPRADDHGIAGTAR